MLYLELCSLRDGVPGGPVPPASPALFNAQLQLAGPSPTSSLAIQFSTLARHKQASNASNNTPTYKNNSLLVGLDDDVNIDYQHQFQEAKFLVCFGILHLQGTLHLLKQFMFMPCHAMPCKPRQWMHSDTDRHTQPNIGWYSSILFQVNNISHLRLSLNKSTDFITMPSKLINSNNGRTCLPHFKTSLTVNDQLGNSSVTQTL